MLLRRKVSGEIPSSSSRYKKPNQIVISLTIKREFIYTYTHAFIHGDHISAEVKVGVVDFARVIEASNYGKKANTELTEWLKERQATLDEMRKISEEPKKELDEQGSTLSPETKKSREEGLTVRLVITANH